MRRHAKSGRPSTSRPTTKVEGCYEVAKCGAVEETDEVEESGEVETGDKVAADSEVDIADEVTAGEPKS